MEFGLSHEFECPEGYPESQAFTDAFELVDAAEAWGLDAVWLAELHVAPGRSVLSSPLTVASAIAARTRRIKIGTAVQILPSATRFGWPRIPPRSTRSARGGSSSGPAAAASRARTRPTAFRIPRAASASPRYSRSLAHVDRA